MMTEYESHPSGKVWKWTWTFTWNFKLWVFGYVDKGEWEMEGETFGLKLQGYGPFVKVGKLKWLSEN